MTKRKYVRRRRTKPNLESVISMLDDQSIVPRPPYETPKMTTRLAGFLRRLDEKGEESKEPAPTSAD